VLEEKMSAAAPGHMRSGRRQSIPNIIEPSEATGIDIDNVEAAGAASRNADKGLMIERLDFLSMGGPGLNQRALVLTTGKDW
jgi:hypothetical protein